MKKLIKIVMATFCVVIVMFVLLVMFVSRKMSEYEKENTVSAKAGPSSQEVSSSSKSPAEIKKILSSLKKKVEKFDGVTWYSTYPQFDTFDNRIEAYIGEKDERFFLRMRISYKGKNWLFIDRIKFFVDGVQLEYQFGLSKVKRDHTVVDGEIVIYEWANVLVEKEEYALLKAIAVSKVAEMRYVGQQYHDDRKISQAERQSISKVITAFESIGGMVF